MRRYELLIYSLWLIVMTINAVLLVAILLKG